MLLNTKADWFISVKQPQKCIINIVSNGFV